MSSKNKEKNQKEEWSPYLDHHSDEVKRRFVINEKKTIRFRHSDNPESPKERQKWIEFKNGAQTKWHIHTEDQEISWKEGTGFVEWKIILHKRTWKNFWLRYKIIRKKITKSEAVKIIPANTYHRIGGTKKSEAFICLTKTCGYTIWNKERHYAVSTLPTLSPSTGEIDKELLFKLYSEVHSNYRHLADIRFKLLGFVPAISIIAWATLASRIYTPKTDGEFDPQLIVLVAIISIMGLLITIGIKIYDTRNDSIYNDLISRGRKIEEELGVHTGIFKGRIKGGKFINHGMGLNFIYYPVIIGWLLMSIWLIMKI